MRDTADRGGVDVAVPGVGLAEAVDLVRRELERAAESGAGSKIAFRPEAVELEVEVVFQQSVGADGGVRVWVVSLGGKADVTREVTHRLKVALVPVDRATGASAQISDVGPAD